MSPAAAAGGVGATIEAFDRVSNSWTRGNVAGYAEKQKIPYRLILSASGAATVNFVDTVFDHTDNRGVPGIEDLKDLAVCTGPLTSAPPGASACTPILIFATDPASPPSGPYAVGPTCTTVNPTTCKYSWHNITIPAGSSVTLVWGALLALGSHNYNGAALHMKIGDAKVNGATVSLGGKDVPIPVNQIIATETDKKVNGSDAPTSVNVGATVRVTIAAKTFGPPKGTQDLTIKDELPACLRYANNASPAPTSVMNNGDGSTTVTWFFAAVPNGTTKTVAFDAVAVSPGNCLNVAITESNVAPPTTDTVTVPVRGVGALTLSKDCPASSSPGAVVRHTLNFSNTGSGDAAGVTISDVLGSGLTYMGNVQATINGVPFDAQAAPTGNTVVFTIGTLAKGASGVISYDVKLAANAPAGSQSFTDTATISSTSSGVTAVTKGCTTTATYAPDLGITKSCPASVTLNTVVQHTVGFSNTGTASATSTVVTDVLAAGLSYQGNAKLNGVLFNPQPVAAGNTVIFPVGTLAPGGTGTITYDVKVTQSGQQSDTASISSAETDSNPSNNSATCLTGVTFTDVYVSKACPASAQPGDKVTHTLNFGNQGSAAATAVVITDVLDPGLAYVPGSAKRNGAAITPGVQVDIPSAGKTTLTFDLGTLAANSFGQITYEVTVPASSAAAGTQTFQDQATITTSSSDSNTANNTSQACPTTVSYQPTLNVSKTACPSSVVPGGILTYTINASNTGTAPASGATLTDNVPTGTTVADAGGGGVSPDGRTVTWGLGTLAVGGGATRSLAVLVTAGNGSLLSNTVTLNSGSLSSSFTLQTTVSNAGAATAGSAYGVDIRALGLTLADKLANVQSQAPGSPAAAGKTVVPLAIPGILTAGVITTATESAVTNKAETTSIATTASVDILSSAITSKTVHGVSHSVAGPFGATFDATGSSFEDLRINGTQYANVAPNTVVDVKNPLPLFLGQTVARAVLYESTGSSSVDPSTGRFSVSHVTNMIHVTLLQPFLTLPAGAEIIVSHAQTTATYPSGLACGAVAHTVSGEAFTAFAEGALGTVPVATGKIGDAVLPATGGSASNGVLANVPGVVTSTTAANSTSGVAGPTPDASAASRVQGLNVLSGVVTADVVDVTSHSSANGSSASTNFGATFVNLKVGGTVVNVPVAANTIIAVPQSNGDLALVILNEQAVSSDGTKNTEGTINAVHVYLLKSSGLVSLEVIVASAHSDAHF